LICPLATRLKSWTTACRATWGSAGIWTGCPQLA